MSEEVWKVLEVMAEDFNKIREEHDFTHAGTTPAHDGAIVWGLRYPSTQLYAWNTEKQKFEQIYRSEWEWRTWMPPPWPWTDAGMSLLIPHYQAMEGPE